MKNSIFGELADAVKDVLSRRRALRVQHDAGAKWWQQHGGASELERMARTPPDSGGQRSSKGCRESIS